MSAVKVQQLTAAHFSQRVQHFSMRAMPDGIVFPMVISDYEAVPEQYAGSVNQIILVCNNPKEGLEQIDAALNLMPGLSEALSGGGVSVLSCHLYGVLCYRRSKLIPIIMGEQTIVDPMGQCCLTMICMCCLAQSCCSKTIPKYDFAATDAARLAALTQAKDYLLNAYNLLVKTPDFPNSAAAQIAMALAICYDELDLDGFKRACVSFAYERDPDNLMVRAAKEAQDTPHFFHDVNVSTHVQNKTHVTALASARSSATAMIR